MFKRFNLWGVALSTMLFAEGALAFPCFITMVKDSCWTDYTVTIEVLDAEKDNILTTIVIPKGESWSRGRFEARPKHHFMLRAKFEPAFWAADAGKMYYAAHYWILPDAVQGKTTALHISACYPEGFSGVPLPPKADSTCACPKPDMPNTYD